MYWLMQEPVICKSLGAKKSACFNKKESKEQDKHSCPNNLECVLDDSCGDPCHYNLFGLKDEHAKEIFKQNGWNGFFMCVDGADSVPLTLETLKCKKHQFELRGMNQ